MPSLERSPQEDQRLELDLLDRKILYLLSLNGRFAESTIGKALKTSKEVVHYRLKRMQQESFLHGFMTLLDHQKLGYIVHDISVSLHPSSDFEAIVQTLLAHQNVTHVRQCSAPFDLQFRIMTKTTAEFVSIVDSLLNQYYMYVKDYVISTLLEEHFLGLHFLLEEKEIPKINERKGTSFHKEFEHQNHNEERDRLHSIIKPEDKATLKLDDKDKQILQLLSLQARLPILKISQQMSLATTSVQNRLQALVKAGIIKQFLPQAAFSYLGYQWYLLRLRTKNLNQAKFSQYLQQQPNMVWMTKHVGKWNFQLSIFAQNNNELNRVVQELRNSFLDSIIAYESEIVFKQFAYQPRIL
ncbi:MAG: Lrp/AsnC family transcriptional regulator [Nanoarchaeota archaeon]